MQDPGMLSPADQFPAIRIPILATHHHIDNGCMTNNQGLSMDRVVRLQIGSHPYFIMNILTGEPMHQVETLSAGTTLSMRRKVLQIIEDLCLLPRLQAFRPAVDAHLHLPRAYADQLKAFVKGEFKN